MPAPADERIFGHVMDELLHRFAAVALGILDLLTNLAQLLAHPRHLDRRQMPLGMTRQPRGVEVVQRMPMAPKPSMPRTTASGSASPLRAISGADSISFAAISRAKGTGQLATHRLISRVIIRAVATASSAATQRKRSRAVSNG
jgi:hypothetical protein